MEEQNATLRQLIAEVNRPLWRAAALARLEELELQVGELRRVLTLAQDHLHALLCIKYTGGKQCHATCQDAKDVLADVVQKKEGV